MFHSDPVNIPPRPAAGRAVVNWAAVQVKPGQSIAVMASRANCHLADLVHHPFYWCFDSNLQQIRTVKLHF